MSKTPIAVPEDKCTVRVVVVRRNPTRSPEGVLRRPRVINEVVVKWYNRCGWCNEWFKPFRADQRFCCPDHRHAAFRQRRREELAELRRKVGKR